MAAINVKNPDVARLVLMELERRARQKKPPVFRDPNFPKQTAFQEDKARLKAAQCTRRAGKSYGVGLWLCEPAFLEPGVTCGYVALTRKSAKGIMWRDVLKTINRRLGLGAKFNESELVMRFPNESEIFLTGADATPDEMEKFLGQKYRRIGIDESASFRQDLSRMVYEMFLPALSDLEGELALIGTTGELTKGLFFDVTNGIEPGWAVHKWSATDNPYMREAFMRDMELLKKNKPGIEQTPAFRRMYLNEWVIDTDNLVYRYDRERNWVPRLPEGRYTYLLGLDLGFNDDTAFSVLAYSESSPVLYVVKVVKEKGLDLTAVAERVRHLERQYPFVKMIVDGAAKQAVEELRNRHNLPLEAAEKQGKADFIEIMNAEYLRGVIKLVGEESEELETEYLNLIWDPKELKEKLKKIEHPACANHAADATLYPWRYAYNYLFKEKTKETKTEEQKVDEWVEREARLVHDQQFTPFWER